MSTTNTNKTVIDVTVNGLTAVQACAMIEKRMETIERKAFNVAVLAAYAQGVDIPTYGNFIGGCVDKSVTGKAFGDLVKRDKSTVSRWCGAMKLIIAAGRFTDFASGLFSFSYDKIYFILSDKTKGAFSDKDFGECMKMSVSSLEAIIADYNHKAATSEEQEGEQVEVDKVVEPASNTPITSEEQEQVEVEVDGKRYTTTKAALAAFMATCTLVKEEQEQG